MVKESMQMQHKCTTHPKQTDESTAWHTNSAPPNTAMAMETQQGSDHGHRTAESLAQLGIWHA
jgi:hypothetical protein